MVLVPSRMGRLNTRALIGRLQRLGTASRADLAKSLGLSQPTAGKIADQLVKLGVLEELGTNRRTKAAAGAGPAKRNLGRPGRLLRLNGTCERFVAVHLGLKTTRVAVLPIGVNGNDDWTWECPAVADATAWSAELARAPVPTPGRKFWGVLVSVPGIVDETSGKVLFSPNLHWTESVDVPRILRGLWKLPVILVQEERALALGHHATSPSSEDFLLVDFGDGVGGAAIVGGRPFAGPLPISGELGHTPVPGNFRRCGCGAVGCLETLVSERGLLESFAAEKGEHGPTLDGLRGHISANGIPVWLAQTLDATAAAIAGALNVMGLRHVVVTGTLAELAPAVFAGLSEKIVNGTMWARFGEVKCEPAPRRRAAGLVAAGIDRLVAPISAPRHETKSLLPPV